MTAPAHDKVDLPRGFRAAVGSAGLREHGDDISIVVADTECASSAVFTKSLFAGPSVNVSRQNAEARNCRGVVVIAKNANVATGAEGEANAREVLELAAGVAGVAPEQLLLASTGVIGRQYPMDKLRNHFGSMNEGDFDSEAHAVATAMMTTDTHAKTCVREIPSEAGTARIVGVAKGVGMIEPDMATMIATVLTDAAVDADQLDRAFRGAVNSSFNCLSVDTDTSTSDTAICLAGGAAGPVDADEFAAALAEVCLDLTRQLARDGEGATKLLTVEVTGGRDDAQAKRVAKAILNSPLVKTAVHGADPNWGRVAMAIGKCSDETDIDPAHVRIVFGDLETYPSFPGEAELKQLTEIMKADDVTISVDLGIAGGVSTVYGCDLTREYIAINADYTT